MFFSRNNKPKKKVNYTVNPELASEKCFGQTCSICGTEFSSEEYVVYCPCCNLPYHADCWQENNGCGSYGCDAAPEVEKTETIAEDTYIEGWVADKKCPSCGKTIKGNALICKYCRAKFTSEKPMTRAQWLNRPYDENELRTKRLLLLVQFIASAFGVFTVVMVPINIITYTSNKFLYDFKRLPSELKLLNIASNIVGILWVFLGLLAIVVNIFQNK